MQAAVSDSGTCVRVNMENRIEDEDKDKDTKDDIKDDTKDAKEIKNVEDKKDVEDGEKAKGMMMMMMGSAGQADKDMTDTKDLIDKKITDDMKVPEQDTSLPPVKVDKETDERIKTNIEDNNFWKKIKLMEVSERLATV